MKKILEKITFKKSLILLYAFIVVLCRLLSKGLPDIIVLIMLGIVGLIFLNSYKLFGKVENIKHDLLQATDKLNTIPELSEEEKNNVMENLFDDPVLSESYKNFIAETDRLNELSDGTYKCDISEYINIELVDITIEKNLLNLVPGSMTGLGILGTFIGLSMALQNFNTGTAEEISNSIAPLMDGIKVAFHTSIYGMLLSLFYNYIMKTLLEETYTKVDNFLKAYEKYTGNGSENDNNGRMQFLVKDMPVQIALQLKEVLEPLFTKIDKSLDLFNENARQEQEKGIEKMVNIFDKKMGDSLEHLSTIIEKTSELQKTNNENILTILPKVTEIAENVTDINKLSTDTITKMSEYITDVEKLQNTINESFERACATLEKEVEAFENVKAYTDALNNQTTLITDRTTDILDKANAQLITLSEINEKHVESINKAVSDTISSVNDKTNIIINNVDTKLGALITNLDEFNAKITDNSDKQISSIGDASKDIITEVKEQVASYINQLAEHENELKDLSTTTIETLATQAEIITQLQESLTDHAQESVDKLSDSTKAILVEMSNAAKQQVESIHQMSAGVADSMNEATRELSDVTKDLSKNLKFSIDKIFEEIDHHLAEVASRLSGTIKDVEDTTERVPATVNAAYEGMENTLNELKTTFNSLVNDLKDFEKHIYDSIEQTKITE